MTPVPTSDIYQRTFCIKTELDIGTGFLVPIDTRIAMITCTHIVESLPLNAWNNIEMYTNGKFETIRVKRHSCSKADVSVLETEFKHTLGTSPGLKLSGGHIVLGQDTFFLGYPYFGVQVQYSPQSINNGFPFPLIKKAVYSGSFENFHYLDGHNNPGFSGGPATFQVSTEPMAGQRIFAVIAGYLGHKGDTGYLENSGIIVAVNINIVTEKIREVFGKGPLANA